MTRLGLAIGLMACSGADAGLETVEPGPVPPLSDGHHRLEVLSASRVGPATRRLMLTVRARDTHRVHTVEALGARLGRLETPFCGSVDGAAASSAPDDDVWNGLVFVGDENSVTIVARVVMGHEARLDVPLVVSMVAWAIPGPSEARIEARDESVLVLRGPHSVLVVDTETGQERARYDGAVSDAVWGDVDGLVVRRRLSDGRHVLWSASADEPWDLPGDALSPAVSSGRVLAVTLGDGGAWLHRHRALPPIRLPAVPTHVDARPDGLIVLRGPGREEWRDERGDLRATSMTPTVSAGSPASDEPPADEACLPGARAAVARTWGTLAVSGGPPRARLCPREGRGPHDEPLPDITRVDGAIPLPDGLLVQGRDADGGARLVMLRP